MVGMSFFLPFIPLYLGELGISDPAANARWSGAIFASGFFVLSFVAPIWGNLADRWGRKLMVVRAMATGSLILLLTSFVQTPFQLLGLRLLHGCFSGFVSSAIALIATESPESSLGFGMGFFQSALTAGFIVGPFFGGLLQDAIGIRPTILGGAFFLFAGTALVFLLVKEKNKPAPDTPKGSALANARFVLSNPTLWPAARLQFFSNLAMMSVQPILALFVGMLATSSSDRLGTLSGLVISASALSMMVGAPLWGRLADKVGQKKVLTLCLFASGVFFIPQGLSQNIPQLFVSRFLLGFFAAGISPSLQAMIAHHSPPDRRAGVLGVSFSITLFGNAIGPLVGGFLASSLGLRIPFLMVSAILIGTGFLSRGLKIHSDKPKFSVVNPVD